MKEAKELVQRIRSCYVGDDCVQLSIPYDNAITILNKDGIMYHHKEGSDFFVNKYTEDERRKQFPYHNIPTYYEKSAFKTITRYTNQLLEFDVPYFRINNGSIVQNYIIKDKNEALSISRVAPLIQETEFKTREELEKLFQPPTDKNENLYLIFMNGTMPVNNEIQIASEDKILEQLKKDLSQNVEDFKDYVVSEPMSTVGSYLNNHPFFLYFVEQSISNLDLKNYNLDISITGNHPIVLVKTNGKDINIKAVSCSFVTSDCYKVDIYDIPVAKYTLDQLKYLAPKIIDTRDPKISLKLNPGVSEEDIKNAKQMVKNLTK